MNRTLEENKSNRITNLGIALVLLGVPLGMYCNQIFPVVKWSPVFMLLSVLFICSYKNIVRGKLPSFNRVFLGLLVFQLLMLLYGAFSTNLTSQYASFHAYIITLILALSSNKNNLNYEGIVTTTFFVSIICTLLGFYFLRSRIVTDADNWSIRQQDSFFLEPFTIASGALFNFVSGIFLLSKKKKLKYLIWTFIALDVLVLFMSTKRTPVFVALIILALYLYRMGSINKRMIIQYTKLFLLLVVCFLLLYFLVDSVYQKINEFSYSFYNGVLNILGNTEVSDAKGSAIMRYKFRLWTYNYIENEFQFYNYILGAGYMTKWIDSPVLQAYLDMGILGTVLYIKFVIMYPIGLGFGDALIFEKRFFKWRYPMVLLMGYFKVLLPSIYFKLKKV